MSAKYANWFNYLRILQDLLYRALVKPFRADYWSVLLQRPDSDSEEPLVVQYIGDGSQLAYVNSLFFDGTGIEQQKKPMSLRRLLFKKYPQTTAEFRVLDLDWPLNNLAGEAGVAVPYWVKQKITLSGSWEDYLARMRRKTRREAQRMIRKFDLHYKVVEGLGFGPKFYETLYKPYIQQRHGDTSIIINKDKFLQTIQHSHIMQLWHDQEVIAAAQITFAGDTLNLGWTGVAKNEGELRGAADALDYFCVQYAFEKGCRYVDMGHSRAVLSDGILRYKKKWAAALNAGVVPQGTLSVALLHLNATARRFLENNPLLSKKGRDLEAHILLPRNIATEDQLQSYLQEFSVEGVNTYRLYVNGNQITANISSGLKQLRLCAFPDEEQLGQFWGQAASNG